MVTKTKNLKTILVAGQAGQGIDKTSDIICLALTKLGYYVFNYRYYQTIITGGKNFNVITFSESEINCHEDNYDVAIFLHEDIEDYIKKLKRNAIIICDEKIAENYFSSLKKLNVHLLTIDCEKIMKKNELAKVVKNSILMGTFANALGIQREVFFEIFETEFKKLLKENKLGFEEGYKLGKRLIKLRQRKKKIVYFKGNDAIAYAFRLAGIDAYLAYPMTPSTGLLHNLAKTNGFVYQPENEIAVINAALGIAACGKKVAIGSSGGGFALMIEALSFAGMAELPLVIYLVSRYGPSTGVPPCTSQADLKFAINAGHGSFAKIVLSLSTIENAMINAIDAFNFAYSYRIPVILLTDKHFAESGFSMEEKQLRKIEAYAYNSLKKLEKFRNKKQKAIFNLTKSYPLNNEFAPLPLIGYDIFKLNSYEHDEYGFFSEDSKVMKMMSIRRKERIDKIKKMLENRYQVYGNKNAKNLIISWGSTINSLLDFVNENKKYKLIDIVSLSPFPEIKNEIKKAIKKAKNVYVFECSPTSQLSDLIAENTGIKIPDKNKILKYDGTPFLLDDIKKALKTKI
ncbi:MAG: 2-oxoacid:acceptor oxidoreductase family protein [Candidatus Pacearchaeota archaeon]